jgi:hypothetical protein
MNIPRTQQILFTVLQALLGLMFIASALLKLPGIERLEFTMVENIHLGWFAATIASRALIAFELFLGLHLFLYHGHRWNKWISFITLLVFTVYLVLVYFLKGNEEDCGCFGKAITFTTLQGIYKNLILLALNIALLFDKSTGFNFTRLLPGYFQGLLLAGAVSTVLIVQPLYTSFDEEDTNISLNWDLIYKHPTNPAPDVELRTGKHIIAFLSSSCMYCKRAAYKLSLLHEKYPSISVWFFINGTEEDIQAFLEKTKSGKVPHSKFNGPKDFQSLAGNVLPAIYFIDNGNVIHKRHFDEIRESDFSVWNNSTP